MDRKLNRKVQKRWTKDPNEKCPTDTKGNNMNVTCFVPSCCNQMWRVGRKNRRLLFFKVPNGMQGLLWTKAIRKTGLKAYEKCVESLSRGVPTNYFSLRNRRYCCEAHFDIKRDIERIVNANGSVEFRVKVDVLPSVKRIQKERLIDIHATAGDSPDDCEMRSEFIIGEEPMPEEIVIDTDSSNGSTEEISTNDMPSIVALNEESNVLEPWVYYEIRTLDDQHTETGGCEQSLQMLPSTIALIKRKPLHYTGLEPHNFCHLFESFKNQTNISELKLMLTLRKLRLNEDFETLADLFDLDKTTTEKYFNEGKHVVAKFVGAQPPTSTTTASTTHTPVPTQIRLNQCVLVDPTMLCHTEMNGNEQTFSGLHGSQANANVHQKKLAQSQSK